MDTQTATVKRRGRRAPTDKTKLRTARENAGLSPGELAEKITVIMREAGEPAASRSARLVQAAERGESGISPATARAWAEATRPETASADEWYQSLLLPEAERQ